MSKATIHRAAWRPTSSQRRDASRRARPGARLLGPRLPLAPELESAQVRLDGVPLRLTHLHKPYFPGGLTKRDLLDYNFDLAEFLLPHLRDRPYTQKRYPDGSTGPFFFQKEGGEHLPEWVRTAAIPSSGERSHVNFVLCNDCPTLLYLVNNGCIDHNIWMSRYQSPLAPDFVLLDLDPGERAGFPRVIRVAQAIRRVLEETLAVPGFPKTSGATGLHVWLPLAPGQTYRQSQQFAALVLRLAARSVPDDVTEVLQVRLRPADRVYLDFRQNAHGKTIPPPYSPRPGPGAPVSAPLRWSEIRPGLDPAAFNIRSVRRRLEKYGDLFAPALPAAGGISIADVLDRLDPEAAAS